jgi:CHAT domain-containing protein/tetratricopeptide (TPR) repeat protein
MCTSFRELLTSDYPQKIMNNKSHFLKSIAIASFGLMVVTTPMTFPVTLAQTSPAATDAIPVDLDKLLKEGETQKSQKKSEAALAIYLQVWNQARQRNIRQAEMRAIIAIRNVFSDLKQPEQAVEFFKPILAVYRESNNREMEAFVLSNIGHVFRLAAQLQTLAQYYPQALAYYEQAMTIYKDLKQWDKVADMIGLSAEVYKYTGQNAKVIESYNQMIAIYRETNNRIEEAVILNRMSLAYKRMGEPLKALEHFNQMLNIVREVKTNEDAIKIIKRVSLSLSDQDELNFYNQVLNIYRENKNREMEAFVLGSIGSEYSKKKGQEAREALEYYTQALTIYRDLKILKEEASILKKIEYIYSSKLEQYEKALEYENQLLSVYRRLKNQKEEASTLKSIGSTYYYKLKQPGKGIRYYLEALSIYRKLKDRKEESRALALIGSLYERMGQMEQAIRYYTEQLEIDEADKDRFAGKYRQRLCALYAGNNKPKEALDCYAKLLAYYRKDMPDRAQEAEALSSIGNFYSLDGNTQEALEYLNQSLTIYREIKNKVKEAETLDSIANVHRNRGEFQKALDRLTQSLTILRVQKTELLNQLEPAQRNKDRKLLQILFQEASLLNSMGDTYSQIGDQQQALEYLNQAAQITAEAKQPFTRLQLLLNSSVLAHHLLEPSILVNMGQAYFKSGQHQKALEHYSQALTIFNNLKAQVPELKSTKLYDTFEATAIGYSGEVYAKLGQHQKALEYYNRALPMFRNARLPLGEGVALSYIGQAHQRLGQQQEALKYYNQALPILRQVQNRRWEADLLYSFARLSREQGDLSKALEQIGVAIQLVESIRGEIQSNELRTTYLASVQDYYKLQIDLLMEQHRQDPSKGYNQQALQASERARARGLNDLLNEARIDIREGVDPTLLTQERDLLTRFRDLATLRAKLLEKQDTAEQLKQLDRDYATLQQQYQQNQVQIRTASPRYAALTQPQPLAAGEIQALLDDDTLLLNYSLGTDRSYLWLVGKNGLTSYELPKAKEIGDLVRRYYSLLTDKDALTYKKAELEQVGQQLSKMLLGPVGSQLGQKRLVVVADGALFYLPFAALPVLNGQQPLLTQHEIVHLPSATTLALLRRDTNRAAAPKTLALLADPVFGKDDPRLQGKPTTIVAAQPLNRTRFVGNGNLQIARLPFTETEAQNIGRLVPPNQQQSWLGFAANLTNATTPQLNDYRIVHFATHGVLDSQNPQRSGLILSRLTPNGTYQNGDLTLQEIFNLKLQAELVVLSACQTGMGQSIDNVQDIQGEGLVGLTRGFMYAGTPRVMVSLWNVNDESTAALMSQFYQNKLAKGMTPAAALRQAQLEMLRNPKYQAPYYWAPFILQGEWR